MSIKFSDGIEIKNHGPLTIIEREDGFYVVGEDLVCAVESIEEGQKIIREILLPHRADSNKD